MAPQPTLDQEHRELRLPDDPVLRAKLQVLGAAELPAIERARRPSLVQRQPLLCAGGALLAGLAAGRFVRPGAILGIAVASYLRRAAFRWAASRLLGGSPGGDASEPLRRRR